MKLVKKQFVFKSQLCVHGEIEKLVMIKVKYD